VSGTTVEAAGRTAIVPGTEFGRVVVVADGDDVGAPLGETTGAAGGAIGSRDTTTSEAGGWTVAGTCVPTTFEVVRFRTVVVRAVFFDVLVTDLPTIAVGTGTDAGTDFADFVDFIGTGRAVVTGETVSQAETASPTIMTTRRFIPPTLGDLSAIQSAIHVRVL
jgi:hypothetical protein